MAVTSKGELLMLVHRIPYPPDKGDKIRSFNQLKYLSERGWQVHLCCLADDPEDLKYARELGNYCASVHVEPLNPKVKKAASILAPLQGTPMSVRYFYSRKLQQKVDHLLQSRDIDAVFCYCSPMAEYLYRHGPLAPAKKAAVPRRVMDLVDVDSDKWEQYAARVSAPMKWVYRLEGSLLRRYEREVVQKFDATVLVSEAETEVFRKRIAKFPGLHAVGNGVDLDFFRPGPEKQERKTRRITFCGAMGYLPNIDAVTWFAREVLPLVSKRVGEVEFRIIGGGVGNEVWALQELEGVRVMGKVTDVRPFVWDSDISVAPVRIARGIQNKVLEAMAMGVATVVTPQAFEGLEVEAGNDVIVAPADPAAFALAVIEMLTDRKKRDAVARSGRGVVERKYSWQRRLQLLERLLSGTDCQILPLGAGA